MKLIDRVMCRVSIDESTGCWLWTAGRSGGYARIKIGRSSVNAHRVAYQLLVGPIPEGTELDHLCRVRHCVNPEHVEPVTRKENILRGESPTARNARKTHCEHGHAFTPENTIVRPSGWRGCRLCGRAAQRRYKRRRRSAAA